MIENQESSREGWDRARKRLGIVLLVVISYWMGLGHGRSEKRMGEYSALKAQYDRIEAEYTTLKAEYEVTQVQCQRTQSQYSALKAQYDRIETHRDRAGLNPPRK